MTTSSETYTITTVSGRTRVIPDRLIDQVVGLDDEGRIVVDTHGYLNDTSNSAFLFGLTMCCDAFDKGVEDAVVCRGCYSTDDTGNYLWFNGHEFDGLDPISADPHPTPQELR